jgi:hypothetical protein
MHNAPDATTALRGRLPEVIVTLTPPSAADLTNIDNYLKSHNGF